MKKIRIACAAAALVAAIVLLSNAARSVETPEATAHHELSATQGLNAATLPVLKRVALDQNTVADALVRRLRPGASVQKNKMGNRLHVTAGTWHLLVTSDGASADFHDTAVEQRAHSLGLPIANKMSSAAIIQKGREVIASQLASQITLASGETLVALRTDYRIEEGVDVHSKQTTSKVVANRVVFTRAIAGVHVVGKGSKVSIVFSNDGTLESFHYDWPKYTSAAGQKTAAPEELVSRVQKAALARTGETTPPAKFDLHIRKPSAFPITASTKTQIQSMDCGYYDDGFKDSMPQAIQPGCTYQAIVLGPNGIRDGVEGAVPAGESFTVDDAWPETRVLLKAK
jgi:hypothetical protein